MTADASPRTHDNHKEHPRRLRWARSLPRAEDQRIALNDADFAGILEPINRHGPLPSNYLHEFDRSRRANYANLSIRLKRLFHGDDRGSYLVKPKGQFLGIFADSQHLVYDLAPRAHRALAERGALAQFSPTGSAWFLHQLMQACVGASFELTAPSKGLHYVGREEVLTSPRCREARGARNPMALPLPGTGDRALIPDDLFALENAEGRRRHFIVEIDRATESMEPRATDRNLLGKKTTYFSKKLTSYIDLLRAGVVRSWWGIAKPNILIVTTDASRAHHILQRIRSLKVPEYEGVFAVTWVPAFGDNWRVPRAVLTQLLNEPWLTTGDPRDISQS